MIVLSVIGLLLALPGAVLAAIEVIDRLKRGNDQE